MLLRAAAVVLLLFSSTPVHALDITACGQIIPSRETGVLQADLTCPTPILGCYACPGLGRCFPTGAACTTVADCAVSDDSCGALPAVWIDANGRLDMNGHAVVATDGFAVVCRPKGRCTVTSTSGRGDISGSLIGILMRSGKLDVSNVDAHDNGSGIYSPLLDVRLTLTNVTVNNNIGDGILGKDVKATDVTANGNGGNGIVVPKKVQGTNITANDNAYAGIAFGTGITAAGVVATGNGTVAESGGGGGIVGGGKVLLSGSTITGNTFNHFEGTSEPLDVITVRKPKLLGTTCDHSTHIDTKTGELGPTWGVCAAD